MNVTPIASPRSGKRIDAIAYRLIKAYQPAALKRPKAFDIEEFFEFDLGEITGVSPDYRELPWGIYGYTDSESMVSIISSDMVDDPAQENFARSTIAHECGHAVIHVDEFRLRKALLKSYQQKNGALLYRRDQIQTFRDPEWQAHRFAGGLLMPEDTLRMALRENASFADLSEIYKVSVPFVMSRLRGLKLLGNENGGVGAPPFSNGGQLW